MEFFFLTQNVYIEVLVFFILIIVLVAIWGRRLYNWIKKIYEILNSTRRARMALNKVTKPEESQILRETDIDADLIGDEVVNAIAKEDQETQEETNVEMATEVEETQEESNEIEGKDADTIFLEKLDTSNVEKIANIISSVRTLIARGMIIEAKAMIIEGLSLEKDHRDLNFLLGTIYEQE